MRIRVSAEMAPSAIASRPRRGDGRDQCRRERDHAEQTATALLCQFFVDRLAQRVRIDVRRPRASDIRCKVTLNSRRCATAALSRA
jgi:hypothetical protein